MKRIPNRCYSTWDSETVASCVRHWLEDVVIGVNLCPFARRPFDDGCVRIIVCNDADLIECATFFRDEVQRLLDVDAKTIETSLIAFPKALHGFSEFWGFVEAMNDLLEDNDLDDIFQLASFHPDYVFEGEGENPDEEAAGSETNVARSNYTNRSPVPVLHILRQASMFQAIQAYGEERVAQIPEKNIELMCGMPLEEFQRLFQTFENK